MSELEVLSVAVAEAMAEVEIPGRWCGIGCNGRAL